MARPRKEIDTGVLERLAAIDCTLIEMAAVLNVHSDTLRDNYSTIIAKGREQGKTHLRKKMFDVAMRGNVAMLIWLSKQRLGYAEKQVIQQNTQHSVDNADAILLADLMKEIIELKKNDAKWISATAI